MDFEGVKQIERIEDMIKEVSNVVNGLSEENRELKLENEKLKGVK
jgi:regulator of replication initiation timing